MDISKLNICQQLNFLPDLVISAETDPVGEGTILLHLLAEDALGLKGLVRWLFTKKRR